MSNPAQAEGDSESRPSTLLNRLLPFSPSLLRSLPKPNRPTRYTRADGIPQVDPDDEGLQPTVQDYHAINGNGAANVRVPKKIATPVRVEGKVWFANERSAFTHSLFTSSGAHRALSAWVSWLNLSILIGTVALALFNASEENQIARLFAYTYAVISIGVLVSFLRAQILRRRLLTLSVLSVVRLCPVPASHYNDSQTRPRPFRYVSFHSRPVIKDLFCNADNVAGPLIIAALLFVAVLANFIIRGEFLPLTSSG